PLREWRLRVPRFFPAQSREQSIQAQYARWDKSLGSSEAVPLRSRTSSSRQLFGVRHCCGAFREFPRHSKAAHPPSLKLGRTRRRRTQKPRGYLRVGREELPASPGFEL